MDFLGNTLLSLPAHAPYICQQLRTAHLDALIYIANNGYEPDSKPLDDAAFTEGFRRLVHRVATGSYLSATMQCHVARTITTHTPLPSLECVHVLARLFVARHTVARPSEEEGDPLLFEAWNGFFAIFSAARGEGGDDGGNGLSLEFLELLLLSFHLLKPAGRSKILNGVLSSLSTIPARPRSPSSKKRAHEKLAIASLALALNCISKLKTRTNVIYTSPFSARLD